MVKVSTIVLALLLTGTAAAGQLPGVALPPLPKLPLEPVAGAVADLPGAATRLLRERAERLATAVRANPRDLVMTRQGPAVRGEIIAIEPDSAAHAALAKAGLRQTRIEDIEGLSLTATVYAMPAGRNPDDLLKKLRKAAPGTGFEANHLYFRSGAATGEVGAVRAGKTAGPGAIGMIDGGVAEHPVFTGPVEQMGFANGGLTASAHGTSVAALAVGGAPMRAPAPGAPLLVADVYGRDPKGGNALYIARALGWMVQRRVRVVAMSLAGPPNALLGRAIAAAQVRGVRIVAAVGNDGPAAPPAYPASFPNVIAVTGVDGRNRALIEAGRALHLDFAAPGADMVSAGLGGKMATVRGTSYAVPLVAALLHRESGGDPIGALVRDARDLGKKGPDPLYGKGLVCEVCRVLPKK